ncbi:MAG: hypothetical protein PHS57_01545 [Alphaproteobacteria bacterium]|nr:hypothetical protein [Alphaproteobacteria bacterium]
MDDIDSFSAEQVALLSTRQDDGEAPFPDLSSETPSSDSCGDCLPLTSDQLSTMEPSLNPAHSGAALGAVKIPVLIRNLPPQQIGLLTTGQVHTLSATQLASMTAEQARALTVEQLESCAWDEEQIYAWAKALDSDEA